MHLSGKPLRGRKGYTQWDFFHELVNKPDHKIPSPPRQTRFLWPFLVMSTISFASTWSVPPSGPDVDWIAVDKVAHVAVYGLLATLWARGFAISWPLSKAALGAALATIGFGLIDEFLQSRNPVRTFEYADLAADVAGTLLALACWLGWPWYRRTLELSLFPRPSRPAASPLSFSSRHADSL
jgi:VanZ family protein